MTSRPVTHTFGIAAATGGVILFTILPFLPGGV